MSKEGSELLGNSFKLDQADANDKSSLGLYHTLPPVFLCFPCHL